MASQDDASKPPNIEQGISQNVSTPLSSETSSQPQAVRFASVNEEIEPAHSLQSFSSFPSGQAISDTDLSPDAQEEIRNLSIELQNSHLQKRRMSNFAFEPVSLPASRVCSSDLNILNPINVYVVGLTSDTCF